MTTFDTLRLIRRRWYVVLVGMAATVAVGMVVLFRAPVWSTQVDVILLPPSDTGSGTSLVDPSDGLISMAGLVEREVNKKHPLKATTTQDVPLAGTGVRKGTLIRQPNSGGQWDWFFTDPSISVQVAGPDHDEVQRTRDRAVKRVQQTLIAIQAADGVRPEARITSTISPMNAAIIRQQGHRGRAAIALLVVGGIITGVATLSLDHTLRRRDRRRRVAQPVVGRELETAGV